MRINTCGYCDKSELVLDNEKPKFKICARCVAIRYCCKDCQKADWPDHRALCKPQDMSIRASELRSLFILIDADREFKRTLHSIAIQLPAKNFIGLQYTAEQVRDNLYLSAEIIVQQTTEENNVHIAYRSDEMMHLFLSCDPIVLSAVLCVNDESNMRVVNKETANDARIHLAHETEPFVVTDQISVEEVLSKPSGSIYYKSKNDGRICHLNFGRMRPNDQNSQ